MIDEVFDKGAGWGQSRTYGTWTEEDGRRFCLWCNRMMRVGDRVEDNATSPHRGGLRHHGFSHVGPCPTKPKDGKGQEE